MTTVKAVRALLGVSQSSMATLLGTSRCRVSDWERETSARKETKQMKRHLQALLMIEKAGLTYRLIENIKEAQKEDPEEN